MVVYMVFDGLRFAAREIAAAIARARDGGGGKQFTLIETKDDVVDARTLRGGSLERGVDAQNARKRADKIIARDAQIAADKLLKEQAATLREQERVATRNRKIKAAIHVGPAGRALTDEEIVIFDGLRSDIQMARYLEILGNKERKKAEEKVGK